MNSKAQQVRSYVQNAIQSGKWHSGDRLPSERVLAEDLNVSHLTVRRGLAELADKGEIVKKHGAGNFVADAGQATQIAVAFPSYLLSDSIRQPVVGLEMQALEQTLDRHRYALSLMWYRPDCFWEDVGQVVLSRGIKGIVLWGHHKLDTDSIQRLLDAGIKIVGRTPLLSLRRIGIPTFSLDRSAIQMTALAGLAERGHHNVAVVRYLNEDGTLNHKAGEPAKPESKMFGLSIHHCLCVIEGLTVDFSNLNAIFEKGQSCTAVLVPDEVAANELYRRCYQRGVQIPDDLSIVALSDMAPRTHTVPLSAADSTHYLKKLSRMAGEHLQKQLEGEPTVCTTTLLVPPVQWRQSVVPLEKQPQNNEPTHDLLTFAADTVSAVPSTLTSV